ncbi:uncharacterized protein B0T15DRAFT_167512 [Chaetomium strumarium]|uniref:Uncharacterized protein n=1 Tax=Chaetomium strumarium TaxID=1170767 RepID=A0AAJ0GW66_9PEZI|nr:hypothetical protein B0T15DRAFT_167512 [Chaetomium strumarium]
MFESIRRANILTPMVLSEIPPSPFPRFRPSSPTYLPCPTSLIIIIINHRPNLFTALGQLLGIGVTAALVCRLHARVSEVGRGVWLLGAPRVAGLSVLGSVGSDRAGLVSVLAVGPGATLGLGWLWREHILASRRHKDALTCTTRGSGLGASGRSVWGMFSNTVPT